MGHTLKYCSRCLSEWELWLLVLYMRYWAWVNCICTVLISDRGQISDYQYQFLIQKGEFQTISNVHSPVQWGRYSAQCCYQSERSNTRLSVLYMESGGHGNDLYKLSIQYMGRLPGLLGLQNSRNQGFFPQKSWINQRTFFNPRKIQGRNC